MRKYLLLFLLTVGGVLLSASFMWTSSGYHVRFGDTLFFEAFKDGWGIGASVTKSEANFQKLGFLKVKTSEAVLKVGISFGNTWNVSFFIDQRDLVPFPGSLHYEFFLGRFGGYALLEQNYNMKLGGYRLSLDNFSYMSEDTVMFCSGHLSMGSTSFAYRALNNTFLFGVSDPDNVVFMGVGGLNWKLSGGAGFNLRPINGVDLKLLVAASRDEVALGFMGRVRKGTTDLTFVFNTGRFYFSVKF
ncbi:MULTISPECIES: hypothetical protein [Thermotoga]|uniref:Uncharacterized protein n=1 Tax=Thermotoga neapolitana (strain ATCC 49049 / DSM 4359 / NBRC 107923 / NS-E) TaxID=309803 RepID=B9K941_THENN|nr:MULTISPECIES: hypothetical protein [Thermotoga]ACM23474.1 Putative uncharacterized protein [Thermotoga neapolitana DSM 4359]AJG41377.1 hypothetical protein TRQ7_07965 [Thermotoga sp. RQ7]KFZ21453.1 hypothetical protein LA10_06859 [Thermotoga neapolitana LA10]